ncbi:SitA6 family polymorphic toxin lipoprotein [Myxococcus faecalis]|uniref:SitA6 family polymorphic toxin lipoprotein n=1 Tax=Myxococcus faecalis TaxID=3115646 RepID=UPI003CF8913B
MANLPWMRPIARFALLLVLAGCSTTPAPLPPLDLRHSDGAAVLVPACTDDVCGLFVLEDLTRPDPRVVYTRGAAAAVRPPQSSPQRNWGRPQNLPPEPVMVFHWYAPDELPSETAFRERLDEWRRRPHERHHIFPQAFAGYFRSKGINVHEWTLMMDAQVHAQLHREAERGPWNTEWKEWRTRTQGRATKAEHFEQASRMIQRYKLFGLPMTYWQGWSIPPSPPSP